MKQAAYFIEVVKHLDKQKNTSPMKIDKLEWSLSLNKKFQVETIAIFKIYPK